MGERGYPPCATSKATEEPGFLEQRALIRLDLCFVHFLPTWKADWQREFIHLLVHSPDAHHNQGWARPRWGFQSSIWVSLIDGRCPSTKATTCISKKMDWKYSSQDSAQHFNIRCRCHKQQLNQLSHNAYPMLHAVWGTL